MHRGKQKYESPEERLKKRIDKIWEETVLQFIIFMTLFFLCLIAIGPLGLLLDLLWK